VGLLSGGAAALFGELFSSLYLRAVLVQRTESSSDLGKLRRSRTERNCLAQVDRCTERMVAAEGYTDTDRGIFILAASVGDGGVDTGCEIEMQEGPYAGQAFRLASPIDRDPAAAYWLARGARVKAAANG
jgi:hypothetical protein